MKTKFRLTLERKLLAKAHALAAEQGKTIDELVTTIMERLLQQKEFSTGSTGSLRGRRLTRAIRLKKRR